MLAVGKKVIYPCQGPCLVSSIVNTTVDEKPMTFYQLVVLSEGGGKLLVPVDKVKQVGIRPLMKQPEIPKLLDQLKRPSKASSDRKQRVRDNLKLLLSGSAFDLAEIVESLTELIEKKALSFGERGTLDRAKRLLVCEISEVTGATKQEAEEQVDQALIARRKRLASRNSSPVSEA
ncbi:MAG TPA: CarD family transcriptional regulator [Blastocatellia bacterium]|nr:CarD family transcriptional regulator [Blastocatellia bacterium]